MFTSNSKSWTRLLGSAAILNRIPLQTNFSSRSVLHSQEIALANEANGGGVRLTKYIRAGGLRVAYLILFAMHFVVLNVQAQPEYDNNAATTNKNSVTAPTNSITISNFNVPSGNDRLLVVGVVNSHSNNSSASFGSTAMTLQQKVSFGGGSFNVFTLALGSGAAETEDVVVGGSFFYTTIGAQSFNNIDQTTPVDNLTSTSGVGSSSSRTVTSATHDLVCDFVAASGGSSAFTITADGSQTETLNDNAGHHNNQQIYYTLGSSIEDGASSVDMDWTFAASKNYAHIGFNLNPASVGSIAAYDENQQSTSKNSVSSPTNSITLSDFTVPAGDDRVLTVAVVCSHGNSSSASFGSTGMTLQQRVAFGSSNLDVFTLTLGSGAAQTEDIVVSGSFFYSALGAQSFHNIDQSTPVDNITTNSGNASSGSRTVTSATNDLVCDFIAASGGTSSFTISADGSQLETFNNNSGHHNNQSFYVTLGSSLEEGAASVDMDWTFAATKDFAHIGLNLNIANPGALPVTLTTFNASQGQVGNELLWQTSAEINNMGFEVERSVDGKHFENIGFVAGNGNSIETINYTFIDEYPGSGIVYYRLKQMDYDGQFEYSPVRSVNLYGYASDETLQLSIYPNPANNVVYVHTESLESGILTVKDMNGRIVLQLESSFENASFNVADLKPGPYKISFAQNGQLSTTKLLKL